MMHFIKYTAFAVLALCFGMKAAMADTNAEEFVKKATVSNKFEIESSKIAQQKAQREDVREFASQMITEHTMAGNELKEAVANSPELRRTQMPNNLDEKHQEMIDQLRQARAEDFDRTYVDMQVKAHEQAVALFSNYAEHGEEGSVEDFADRTLPKLQKHEQHIRQLNQD